MILALYVVNMQSGVCWQLTFILFASRAVIRPSRARNKSRFDGLVPFDVRQPVF
jgi:hypothetical protein